MGSYVRALAQYDWCPEKRKTPGVCSQRKSHVRTGRRWPPATPGGRLQEKAALLTPWAPRTGRKWVPVVQATRDVVFVLAA